MLIIAMGTYPLRGQWIQEQTCQQTPLLKCNLKKINENNSYHGNNVILQQVSWKHSSAPNKAAPKELQHLKSGFMSSHKLQIIYKL